MTYIVSDRKQAGLYTSSAFYFNSTNKIQQTDFTLSYQCYRVLMVKCIFQLQVPLESTGFFRPTTQDIP